MFRRYKVRLKFKTHFASGIPKNPQILLDFLSARAPRERPEEGPLLEELAEEIEGEVFEPGVDEVSKITTTFKTKDNCLVYESRCIKAHIKDISSILGKNYYKVRGLKTIVADRVHVEPEYIPLTRNREPITSIDDQEIRPITIMTRRGPRTAVKVVEYVMKPELEFELVVLNDGVVTDGLLYDIFTYGGTIKGMGQDRGLGWGRYEFEIEAIK